MYVSDYALSLGETAKNMLGSTVSNDSTLKTGWMHMYNNANKSDGWEWTISRLGWSNSASDGGYSA